MRKILKVRFDDVSLQEATETSAQWALGEIQRYITTPNPEIVLKAQNNNKYLKVLNQADLNIPDGIGILWASKFQKITENTKSGLIKIIKFFYSLFLIPFYPKYIKTELRERVTGVDLVNSISKTLSKTEAKVFLLGAAEGIAEETKEILQKKYPGLNISGTFSGTPKVEDEKKIIKLIANSGATILFVAFGAPSQELWIKRNLKKLSKIKLAIGVGGTFDFISGKQKRSPKWMQKLGIEWLYRLFKQPKRIVRIYNATIKFPFTVLFRELKR